MMAMSCCLPYATGSLNATLLVCLGTLDGVVAEDLSRAETAARAWKERNHVPSRDAPVTT